MEETSAPSLRMPTAPRRNDLRSSFLSAVPAARLSMSSSEKEGMVLQGEFVDGSVAGEGDDEADWD